VGRAAECTLSESIKAARAADFVQKCTAGSVRLPLEPWALNFFDDLGRFDKLDISTRVVRDSDMI